MVSQPPILGTLGLLKPRNVRSIRLFPRFRLHSFGGKPSETLKPELICSQYAIRVSNAHFKFEKFRGSIPTVFVRENNSKSNFNNYNMILVISHDGLIFVHVSFCSSYFCNKINYLCIKTNFNFISV